MFLNQLNPFSLHVAFLYPLKTYGFLTFSGDIEIEHWDRLGYLEKIHVVMHRYRNDARISLRAKPKRLILVYFFHFTSKTDSEVNNFKQYISDKTSVPFIACMLHV